MSYYSVFIRNFVPKSFKFAPMKYTLALKKLPFEPDCNQIIYIEGRRNEEVNHLIRRHFWGIHECFKSQGFDFCYIPYLKRDLVSKERLHYNAPYAKCSKEADFMENDNFILDYMIHPENRENIPPLLLYFNPACWDSTLIGAENQFCGMEISAESFEGDEELRKVLDSILEDIRKHESSIRFSISDSREDLFEEEKERKVDAEGSQKLHRKREEHENIFFNPDNILDDEAARWWHQIEENIEKLRQKGVESALIEQLFKNRKQKLSRMHITKDFRIYLPDYFGTEIRMTPLPKALFFLYLKHPEGIMFSYLPDFREELMEIYKRVKGLTDDSYSVLKSIEDVTDPLKNSINEKCSRIREAFVSKFDEHLACYYFVDGERGEVKRIKLPRTLVKYDPEIADLFK